MASSSARAGLVAMVSCCFHGTPSGPAAANDESVYMTAEQQRRRPSWRRFFDAGGILDGGDSSGRAAMLPTMTTGIPGPGEQPPPRWLHDDPIDACMGCARAFDPFFTRKHHCRACGRVFCAACTAQSERILEFGFPEPVRVCLPCSREVRVKNVFYEQHLPLLERGTTMVKHGLFRRRRVVLRFVRSRLLFQYQTVNPDTNVPEGDVKAFSVEEIADIKEAAVDQENGLVGLVVVLRDGPLEHRFDARSPDQRQRWITAMQSVCALRQAQHAKVREHQSERAQSDEKELLLKAESLRRSQERQASFHQERLRKRAEQRESLRAKYNLTAASTAAS